MSNITLLFSVITLLFSVMHFSIFKVNEVIWGEATLSFSYLARLEEVQEELLYYPPALALAKCLSIYIKVFYVMGKALSGELSCPCDRSCYLSMGSLFNGRICSLGSKCFL